MSLANIYDQFITSNFKMLAKMREKPSNSFTEVYIEKQDGGT